MGQALTNVGPFLYKVAPPLVNLRDGKVVDVELAAKQHACTSNTPDS